MLVVALRSGADQAIIIRCLRSDHQHAPTTNCNRIASPSGENDSAEMTSRDDDEFSFILSTTSHGRVDRARRIPRVLVQLAVFEPQNDLIGLATARTGQLCS